MFDVSSTELGLGCVFFNLILANFAFNSLFTFIVNTEVWGVDSFHVTICFPFDLFNDFSLPANFFAQVFPLLACSQGGF